MAQFQVPQFIETEDKIVGPLTIRQFIYIAAAVGLSFFLYFTTNFVFWFVASVFILGGGAALAFVKINSQPLIKVIVSAFKFYWSPQIYVWQPENPRLPKNESTLKNLASGMTLENIVAGLALKHTWQRVETGSKPPPETAPKGKPRKGAAPGLSFPHLSFPRWSRERYQIYQRITGERRAARRVDYR